MKPTKALALGCAAAGTAAIVFACVDPKGSFDDFDQRVPDAAPLNMTDAPPLTELPDITGAFFLAASPTVAPTLPILFYWETELTKNPDGTGTLKVSSTMMSADGHRVGDVTVSDDIPVSTAGEFQISVHNMPVPGAANPISGAPVELDLNILGIIKDENFFCGTYGEGSRVVSPVIDVSGSTFGAVRVTPGAEGMDLPAPVMACPKDMPDGGLPDAGTPTPDAATPDAMVPDANLPDAT